MHGMPPKVDFIVTIDRMKESVLSCMTEHTGQLEAEIKNAVDNYFKTFDVTDRIQGQISRTIDTEIQKAVEQHIRTAFYSPEVTAKIKKMVLDALENE